MEQKEIISKFIADIGITPVSVSEKTAKMLQIERAICYLWREFTDIYFADFLEPSEEEERKASDAIIELDREMWRMITDTMWQNNVMEKEILL